MAIASKPILYNYWRSSCSWRVRMALAWKNIDYEYRVVNVMAGEQTQPSFASVNPNQRVPALDIDGHVLSQSQAILEYLEETRPHRPLLPRDPIQRAQVRKLCMLIGADIQPLQNTSVVVKVAENLPKGEQLAQQKAWGRFWVERGFRVAERELATTAGQFSVGDQFTFADIFLAPQVANATGRFDVDMTPFPTIARIAASVNAIPEIHAAHPSKQPDTPKA